MAACVIPIHKMSEATQHKISMALTQSISPQPMQILGNGAMVMSNSIHPRQRWFHEKFDLPDPQSRCFHLLPYTVFYRYAPCWLALKLESVLGPDPNSH